MSISLLIFLICEILIIGFIAVYMIMPIMGGPFFPSGFKAAKKIIDLAKPDKKRDSIVDLGSGDGRIVIQLARRGYNVRGVELNPFFVLLSNFLLLVTGNFGRGRVYWGNVFKHDLSKYSVVYCYLFPDTVNKLAKKFENEMKPGSKVISNTFKIKKWEIKDSIDKVYLYNIPDK